MKAKPDLTNKQDFIKFEYSFNRFIICDGLRRCAEISDNEKFSNREIWLKLRNSLPSQFVTTFRYNLGKLCQRSLL